MASASTDDLARIATLDCPRARCGSGHASLRAFAAAHTTARATFGTLSTLGAGPRPTASAENACDNDDDVVNVEALFGARASANSGVQCCVYGSTIDNIKGGANTDANGGASSGCAHDAPKDGSPNIGGSSAPIRGRSTARNPNENQCNTVDKLSSDQTPSAVISSITAPSQKCSNDLEQNLHARNSVAVSRSCPVLSKNQAAAGLSPGAPASGLQIHPARPSYPTAFDSLSHSTGEKSFAWTGTCLIEAGSSTHSSSTEVQEVPSRKSVLFGPNVPLEKSKQHSGTSSATPKRPRETSSIDDIASLLSKCTAHDAADDVERAAELLSSLQVPGKRPRRHDGCPKFMSTPRKSEHSSVPGHEGPCELDSSQSHASDIAEDDDNELSFLVTNCDIDADSRSTQFMPYIA